MISQRHVANLMKGAASQGQDATEEVFKAWRIMAATAEHLETRQGLNQAELQELERFAFAMLKYKGVQIQLKDQVLDSAERVQTWLGMTPSIDTDRTWE